MLSLNQNENLYIKLTNFLHQKEEVTSNITQILANNESLNLSQCYEQDINLQTLSVKHFHKKMLSLSYNPETNKLENNLLYYFPVKIDLSKLFYRMSKEINVVTGEKRIQICFNPVVNNIVKKYLNQASVTLADINKQLLTDANKIYSLKNFMLHRCEFDKLSHSDRAIVLEHVIQFDDKYQQWQKPLPMTLAYKLVARKVINKYFKKNFTQKILKINKFNTDIFSKKEITELKRAQIRYYIEHGLNSQDTILRLRQIIGKNDYLCLYTLKLFNEKLNSGEFRFNTMKQVNVVYEGLVGIAKQLPQHNVEMTFNISGISNTLKNQKVLVRLVQKINHNSDRIKVQFITNDVNQIFNISMKEECLAANNWIVTPEVKKQLKTIVDKLMAVNVLPYVVRNGSFNNKINYLESVLKHAQDLDKQHTELVLF